MDGAIGGYGVLDGVHKEEKEEEMDFELDIVCLTDTCGKVEGRKGYYW